MSPYKKIAPVVKPVFQTLPPALPRHPSGSFSAGPSPALPPSVHPPIFSELSNYCSWLELAVVCHWFFSRSDSFVPVSILSGLLLPPFLGAAVSCAQWSFLAGPNDAAVPGTILPATAAAANRFSGKARNALFELLLNDGEREGLLSCPRFHCLVIGANAEFITGTS